MFKEIKENRFFLLYIFGIIVMMTYARMDGAAEGRREAEAECYNLEIPYPVEDLWQ